MPPTDRTPLLENGHGVNGHEYRLSYGQRFVKVFTVPEDQPGWIQSFKFFFGSWMNVLLVFVPLSFVSHHLNWDAALRFSFSFIAIMPLAKVTSCVWFPPGYNTDCFLGGLQLLGVATDQLSLKLGQTLSGLLNASFGNAVEIIVGIAALLQGTVFHSSFPPLFLCFFPRVIKSLTRP